jgi:hypothetical protein
MLHGLLGAWVIAVIITVPSCGAPTISAAILGMGGVGVRIEPEGGIAPSFTDRGDTA